MQDGESRIAFLPSTATFNEKRRENRVSMDWTILTVVGVIFLATLFRSTFGFGEALVAVPLLALLVPVEEAVPLATLVSITVAWVAHSSVTFMSVLS
jgi:uncharacterized membrane protein YfcA